MALGKADLAAATNTKIYTVTSGKTASFNVNICNRNAVAVKIRLAISAADAPVLTEWLEYDYSLAANQTIERTCLIAQSTERVVAYSDTANVTAMAYGFED